MQAITLAEKEGLFTNPMSKYVLVTSLEPCPMCLARIALSQIGTVRYLSTDPTGGANSLQCALPADFQELLANQSIEQMADLPEPLGDLGYAISRESSKALNAKLAARG
jgi:tRNA(Arg) A34 adenosine deaminase TadA